MSPRTGRPPKENPRNASIHIRATSEEKEKIMQYSHESKKTCLELLFIGIEADKKNKTIKLRLASQILIVLYHNPQGEC